MKLIIDIPFEAYYTFKCDLGKGKLNALAEIVANGKPYEPIGDLISREALKAKMFDIPKPKEGATFWDGVDTVGNLIDNAQVVDLWQMRQEATENALKKAEVLYARPKGEDWDYEMWWDAVNSSEESDNE